VCSVEPRERVALTRIAVYGHIRFSGECRLDRGLCRLGNELVLLTQMHEHGRVETADLAQILLGVTTMKGDRGVNALASGRQESHQRAEAVAKYGNPVGALGHVDHGVGGVLDVPNTGISVIDLIKGADRAASPPLNGR
jgi:hypothetical protein